VGAFYYTGKATNRQAVSFPPIPYGILRAAIGFPPFLAVQCIESPPGACVIPAPIFSNVSVNTQNIADSESIAGFGHVVFDVTDRLSLNAGVRYSDDKKDVAFDNSLVTAPINIKDNHTDWRAGIDFKLAVIDNVDLLAGSVQIAGECQQLEEE
jgi:outer membrane receptor protein involved in Fe transport